MSAIATMFGGIQYRSRLEARWAAFMHNIGWEHTYEPLDGDGYIPDFIVYGPRSFFVEVKPAAGLPDFEAEEAKVERGLRAQRQDILIVGLQPFNTSNAGFTGFYSNDVIAGWMYQEAWDAAAWRTCLNCFSNVVVHTSGGFSTYPCDHYDGNAYAGDPAIEYLRGAWSDACNEVRWKGRAA